VHKSRFNDPLFCLQSCNKLGLQPGHKLGLQPAKSLQQARTTACHKLGLQPAKSLQQARTTACHNLGLQPSHTQELQPGKNLGLQPRYNLGLQKARTTPQPGLNSDAPHPSLKFALGMNQDKLQALRKKQPRIDVSRNEPWVQQTAPVPAPAPSHLPSPAAPATHTPSQSPSPPSCLFIGNPRYPHHPGYLLPLLTHIGNRYARGQG